MTYLCTHRWEMVRDHREEPPQRWTQLEQAFSFIQERIGFESKEHFMVFVLDTRNKVIGYETVSVGSIGGCLVHPREVFRLAVKEGAVAIIVAHNHPSGDPTPSRDDLAITKRLRDAGTILGIEVLDHIITGPDITISLKDKGLL